MLNSEKIIEQIQDDAPSIYNILNEEYRPGMIGNYPESWDAFYTENPDIEPPTPDQLLECLSEYGGDNWDVHYWSGRYAQMIEEDSKVREPIRVPFTESDLNDLQGGEHFHWTYDGVPLFIFNTDSNPELDPDSDEYDPSISI